MRKFLRPAIIALAIVGTASVASAAPRHYSGDGYSTQSLDAQLDFWRQFADQG